MEKERFLAFTDAIIAIIATIMVLEFKTPDKSGWPTLAELTIPLLAYALSFFMIMTVWYNHHQLYRDIKNITPRIFLMWHAMHIIQSNVHFIIYYRLGG
ncbi:hypothetical protein ICE98_01962 [Lactococcus lactis]|nr:hypothetical protein [Lactococcus lactis]